MNVKQHWNSDADDALPFGFGITLDDTENIMNKFEDFPEDERDLADFRGRKQHTENDIVDYILRLGERDQNGVSPD